MISNVVGYTMTGLLGVLLIFVYIKPSGAHAPRAAAKHCA